jgi:putative PIN family toxin of toxin-antitoxin system
VIDIVIDTNILVSALYSKNGRANQLLSLLGSNKFNANVSVSLILEYEAVLLRESMNFNLKQNEIIDFIDSICNLSVKHEIFYLWRPYLQDPKDDLVLEIAVASNSKYIVTYNANDFVGIKKFGIDVILQRSY